MQEQGQIHLRPVTEADVDFLYSLRNDPEVRKWSVQKEEVSLETHLSWFREVYENSKIRIYVLERENRIIGNVRVNEESPGIWYVSYAIVSEERGKHYGRSMLQELEKTLYREFSVFCLRARVCKDNEASKRVFRVLGYREMEPEENLLVYEKRCLST